MFKNNILNLLPFPASIGLSRVSQPPAGFTGPSAAGKLVNDRNWYNKDETVKCSHQSALGASLRIQSTLNQMLWSLYPPTALCSLKEQGPGLTDSAFSFKIHKLL